MERDTGRTIVKTFAILSWIQAAMLLLVGVGFLFAGPALGGLISPDAPLFGEVVGGAGITAAIILLLLAALYIATGAGLWNYRSWGRSLALVLAVISLFAFPVGTVIGVVAIWLLGFNDVVRGLFHSSTAQNR
jgi:hypothetical protein